MGNILQAGFLPGTIIASIKQNGLICYITFINGLFADEQFP